MEREKVEKELAFKFSQQLYLDANRYAVVSAEEDVIEEEDEFPGKFLIILINKKI
jgi:hypothetical protein